MLRLIALGIFAVSVCAQNAANPYDLAGFISSHDDVDWPSLWKTLGVTDPPGMPRCDSSFGAPCSADAITVLEPYQVIVAVLGQPEDVYIRFLEVSSGWRYAGSQAALEKN